MLSGKCSAVILEINVSRVFCAVKDSCSLWKCAVALSSPTHFQAEIVLTLQSAAARGSGLLPWAVSWHWIMHFSSWLHCFPKCIFINFLSSFIFSWSLQFFMWNTWELFLKVSFWAGDKCLFRQMVSQHCACTKGPQLPCSMSCILPRTPAACRCHRSCWVVAVGPPASLLAWKCPGFICVCSLTLAKLSLKITSWEVCKSSYHISHRQMGRNMMIPWIVELSVFLTWDDVVEINMFLVEEVCWIPGED